MTFDDSHDASTNSVARLMSLMPDPDRAERVRVRCRMQLGRGPRRAARIAAMTGFAWRVLAPVVVGAFCILYAVMLVATTLRLEGVID